MQKIKLITDSTCDLSKELIKKYDIEMIPLVVNINDESYLDGVDIDIHELLEKMSQEDVKVSTSQVVPSRFHQYYQRYIEEGYSIISIHLSSEISGTYHSACIAKEMVDSDKIFVVDSKNVTSGLGLLVLKAAELIEAGESIEDILSTLDNKKEKTESLLAFESLDNLVKGGRLSKTAGIIGSMLGIKVILGVIDGKMAVKDKMRGSKKAVKYIIDSFEKTSFSKEDVVMLLSIENTDIYMPLKEYLDNNNIKYIDNKVGCTVGIHSGPKACGIFYFKE
ncbi:DegV family protein [Alloiococcus sp. CFN-8]|uniref:DegV family protein n=1 Tax=Alloiococcus sp. CFN-8 TaxID=3416081 RepID=UPI003CE6F1D7